MAEQTSKRTIVVGVDGSAGSDAAVRWCVAMAPLLGAHVVVVHALVPPVYLLPPTLNALWTLDEEIRSDLGEAVEKWSEPLTEGAVAHETRVVNGVPAEELMRIAAEVHADLLVVGRRGHGGFADLVLGSVPRTLSHQADVPLVIVPVASSG